jgi:hypothetical protein
VLRGFFGRRFLDFDSSRYCAKRIYMLLCYASSHATLGY